MTKSRKKIGPRSSSAFDQHIGERLRTARLMRDVSQESLGSFTGVSFQQIQKYEKGMNRLALSRLIEFANLLEVSVEFFLSGAPGYVGSSAKGSAEIPEISAFFKLPHAREVAQHYTAIKNATHRDAVRNVARAFAGAD